LTRHDPLRAARLALLTAHAWLGLIAFDLALGKLPGFTGFARVHGRTRTQRPADRPPISQSAIEDIVWAVDEACVWYVKRAACLQRSVVATRLLRRRGVQAELVIGYRPLPFESHAWVEVDGAVVNDRQQYQKVFTVLDRL
jgi:hypothetical protein